MLFVTLILILCLGSIFVGQEAVSLFVIDKFSVMSSLTSTEFRSA